MIYTIPTCYHIYPCVIHVDVCHLQRFPPVLARVNIKTSAYIFTKAVATDQVKLNQTRKNSIYMQISIPATAESDTSSEETPTMEPENPETCLLFASVMDAGKV